MPLSNKRLAFMLRSYLHEVYWMGDRVMDFCTAFGTGIIGTLTGKSFTTKDTGMVEGEGVGMGTGIVGVSDAVIKNAMYQQLINQNMDEKELLDLCSAVGRSIVFELKNATLSSTHKPVYYGIGQIVASSIVFTSGECSNNISLASSYVDKHWKLIFDAIEIGVVEGFKTATGVLAIKGNFLKVSSPGTGFGAGIIN